jgi:iron(III) transport system substrate-binding protein
MRDSIYRIVVVSLLWPCAVSAQTADLKLAALEKLPAQERQQKLYELAKAEGEAVIYANMDVSAMKPLTDGFIKRYPGTKIASVHFSGAAIITRLESEARAAKPLSDVVLSGQLGVLALIDKKIALRYRSPEREFFRSGLKDQDGLWTAYMTNVMVSAFNTRQVKNDEAPRTVNDLLKPRWKGKLTMDSQSYVWFGTMLQYLGEEAGLRFMKRLNEQNISHQRGRRLMTQLVAAGEFDMTVETNLNSVLTLAKQGAPLSFAPIQPYFLSPSLVFMRLTLRIRTPRLYSLTFSCPRKARRLLSRPTACLPTAKSNHRRARSSRARTCGRQTFSI